MDFILQMKKECSNCKFFEALAYVCRRYPKQYEKKWNNYHYPVVNANDWCGEYQEPILIAKIVSKYIPVEEEFVGVVPYHRHVEVELLRGQYLSFRFDWDSLGKVFVCDCSTKELDDIDELVEEFNHAEEIRKSKTIIR